MSKKRGRTLTLGVIIGFFIGLFLAPKKGTELRQDAKKKIDTIKENPKDVLHETFEDVKDKVYAITPVPGGIGPMTITMLLHNTLEAFYHHQGE